MERARDRNPNVGCQTLTRPCRVCELGRLGSVEALTAKLSSYLRVLARATSAGALRANVLASKIRIIWAEVLRSLS